MPFGRGRNEGGRGAGDWLDSLVGSTSGMQSANVIWGLMCVCVPDRGWDVLPSALLQAGMRGCAHFGIEPFEASINSEYLLRGAG